MNAPPASTDSLLAEQRQIARRVLAGRAQSGDLERLATVAQALDDALSNGGALPVAWIRAVP